MHRGAMALGARRRRKLACAPALGIEEALMGTRKSEKGYPLGMLLDLRERELTALRGELGRVCAEHRVAQGGAAEARVRLEQAQVEHDDFRDRLARRQAQGFTVAQSRLFAEEERALLDRIEEARTEAQTRDKAVQRLARDESTLHQKVAEAQRMAEASRRHQAAWQEQERQRTARAEEAETQAFVQHKELTRGQSGSGGNWADESS